MSKPAYRCLRCEAVVQGRETLKGWSMHWCHDCNLPVWLCPACAKWSKQLTGRKLVHMEDGSHALYAQARL